MKLAPFPEGWALGYLVREVGEDLQVGFMRIVGMEVTESDGIRAIVAAPTGELVRDKEVEHPLVCIVGPGEDRDRVARAGVAEYVRRRMTAEPAAPKAEA